MKNYPARECASGQAMRPSAFGAALFLAVSFVTPTVSYAADCVSGQVYSADTLCTVPPGTANMEVEAWGGGGYTFLPYNGFVYGGGVAPIAVEYSLRPLAPWLRSRSGSAGPPTRMAAARP